MLYYTMYMRILLRRGMFRRYLYLKSSTKGIITVISVLAVFAIVTTIVMTVMSNASKTTFTEISDALMKGKIAEMSINNDKVTVEYKEDTAERKKNPRGQYAYARDTIMWDVIKQYQAMRAEKLEAAAGNADEIAKINKEFPDVIISFNDRNSGNIWNILYPIIGIVLIGVMAFFLFRSMGGQNKQAMNFGKSKANVQGNLKVRFTDVAGADEEKQELQEIVEFLKSPQKFTAVGARILPKPLRARLTFRSSRFRVPTLLKCS